MNVRALYLMCLAAAFLLVVSGAALAQSGPASSAVPQAAPKTEAPAAIEPSAAALPPLPAGIDRALEKALDKKLAPIMRTLAEMQEQKIRLTDVLGGLGYIFGLVGVAAYFKRRS
jgi:nickel transport protein